MSQQSRHAHTHTAGRAHSAGSNSIREYCRPALIMTPLIYEYMNLYLHFPSRSLITSHYAKRISSILHEAGHTVVHAVDADSLSLLLSHSHTHLGD